MNATHRPSGVLCICFPFDSPVPVKQLEKLARCLATTCQTLYLVGDNRINLQELPAHVSLYRALPVLHRLDKVEPIVWSAFLWLLELFAGIFLSVAAVFTLRYKVHTVVFYKSYYYAPTLLFAKLLGKKTVAYLPNNEVEAARTYYPDGFIKVLLIGSLRILKKTVQRYADLCVVQSFRLLSRLGLEPESHKLRLGPLYVDLATYQQTRSIDSRPISVGFVGRLTPEKGIMQFLQAAAPLGSDKVDVCIIGDGPLRTEVLGVISQPDMAHVKYYGWLEGPALVDKLNQLRLLVLPTDNEGVPNIVLEAMACGTPVLATATDGIPDLIEEGRTGFILTSRTPNVITASIRRAITHEDLSQIADDALDVVRTAFSFEAVSALWKGIIHEPS